MVLFQDAGLKPAAAPSALLLPDQTFRFTVSVYQLDINQALARHKALHPHGVQDLRQLIEKGSKKHNRQAIFESLF
jgi:hypothetical protein